MIPDNYDAWRRHDDEMEDRIARFPICHECKEPIQDEKCYNFDGILICKSCLENYHEVYTDDYTF